VYKGAGRLAERALINFFLDTHKLTNGYREIFPPFLVMPTASSAPASCPSRRDQMYNIGEDQCLHSHGRGAGDQPAPRRNVRGRAIARSSTALQRMLQGARPSYGKDTRDFCASRVQQVEL